MHDSWPVMITIGCNEPIEAETAHINSVATKLQPRQRTHRNNMNSCQSQLSSRKLLFAQDLSPKSPVFADSHFPHQPLEPIRSEPQGRHGIPAPGRPWPGSQSPPGSAVARRCSSLSAPSSQAACGQGGAASFGRRGLNQKELKV